MSCYLSVYADSYDRASGIQVAEFALGTGSCVGIGGLYVAKCTVMKELEPLKLWMLYHPARWKVDLCRHLSRPKWHHVCMLHLGFEIYTHTKVVGEMPDRLYTIACAFLWSLLQYCENLFLCTELPL